jgi:CheY-like chemotaxis protein
VLLDMTVPGGMGGIETMRFLREQHPEVTAIATTGYSTEPVRAEFTQHGFLAMLRKPFGANDVQAALAQAMSTAHAQRPRGPQPKNN